MSTFLRVGLFLTWFLFVESQALAHFQITEIEKGSVFEKVGLKENDIIEKINGQEIKNKSDFDTQKSQLKDAKKIRVLFIRDGKEQALHLTIK